MAIGRIEGIGARDIYIHSDTEIPEQDDLSAIDWFDRFRRSTSKRTRKAIEFHNGDPFSNNVLMRASQKLHLFLITYIGDNTSLQLLNMRDSEGKNALFYACSASGPIEKIVRCVTLLIDKGVEMNVQFGLVLERTKINEPIGMDFFTDNTPGYCLKTLHHTYTDRAKAISTSLKRKKSSQQKSLP